MSDRTVGRLSIENVFLGSKSSQLPSVGMCTGNFEWWWNYNVLAFDKCCLNLGGGYTGSNQLSNNDIQNGSVVWLV